MGLNTSGPMSLGGPTAGQSINLELGNAANATVSMGDVSLRTLANVSTGAIGLGDFYGKSNSFGITWTAQTSGITSDFSAISYGGGKFLAATSDGQAATSTDGVTWTTQSGFSAIFAGVGINSIAWSGTKFVAIGSNYNGTQLCATSTDGVTWVEQTGYVSAIGTVTVMGGVCWAGTQFVAVGTLYDFTPSAATVQVCVTSTDGITWTNQPGFNSVITPSQYLSASGVWYVNGTIVAGGFYPDGSGVTLLVTSTDGVSWTNLSAVISTGDVNFAVNPGVCVWNGTQYLLAGSTGAVATSSDLVNWTVQLGISNQYNINAMAYSFVTSVIWTGSQYVTVSRSYDVDTNPFPLCLSSPDSITWTEQPGLSAAMSAPWTSGPYGTPYMTWNGSKYVVVGAGGSIATGI